MHDVRMQTKRGTHKLSRGERRPQHPKGGRAVCPRVGVQKPPVDHLESLNIGGCAPCLFGCVNARAAGCGIQCHGVQHLRTAGGPFVVVRQQDVRPLSGTEQPHVWKPFCGEGMPMVGTGQVIDTTVVLPHRFRVHHVCTLAKVMGPMLPAVFLGQRRADGRIQRVLGRKAQGGHGRTIEVSRCGQGHQARVQSPTEQVVLGTPCVTVDRHHL